MKWLLIALQLAPHVLAAVKSVEDSIKAPGATKKAIVMTAITSAAQVGEAVPNETTALVSALIDNQVKELNDKGVFASKSVAAPVAA